MDAGKAQLPSIVTGSLDPSRLRDRARLEETTHLLSGASAGFVATALLHPLDLIKTRFHVQESGTIRLPRYAGLVDAFRCGRCGTSSLLPHTFPSQMLTDGPRLCPVQDHLASRGCARTVQWALAECVRQHGVVGHLRAWRRSASISGNQRRSAAISGDQRCIGKCNDLTCA